MTPPAPRLSEDAAGLLRTAADVLPGPAYLVGGAVRDALLGRPVWDLDIAVSDAKGAAARLARRLRATLVVLDEEAGVYRLVLPAGRPGIRQIDVSELQGGGILPDLGRRDFTLNAMALLLAEDMPAAISPEALLDPRGGLADLKRGELRCEDEEIIKADPLRILRAFRLSAQLGLDIEPETQKKLRRLRTRVRQPAAERTGAELAQLLSEPGCSRAVRLMDETGVLTSVFEDLEPSRQCALCYYGKGGVLGHTLSVVDRLDFLLADLGRAFPDTAEALRERLGERLKPGHPWRAALMLAALLHDVSKPETARRVGGRLRFFGHDSVGAVRSAGILKALRFPNEAGRTVAAVVAHHLRPGNLAAGGALSDKAVYRFFRDLGEEAEALLLVCWADHASYLPEPQLERLIPDACADPEGDLASVKPPEARKTIRHLRVIAALLRRHFDSERKAVPDRILDGKEIMKALGIPPGPRVGDILEKLREAQAEGKIRSRKDALDYVKKL